MKLTPKQAAERAGTSVGLIYELCRKKAIRHYRVSAKGRRGKILIEEADLAEFLNSSRVEPVRLALPKLKIIQLD